MIIGISGASSSGKTTTAQNVASVLKRQGFKVTLCEEVTRKLFLYYQAVHKIASLDALQKNASLYLEFEYDWISLHLREIELAQKTAEVVIADRTAFDVLPYVLMHTRRCDGEKTFDEILKKVVACIHEPPYDVVFFFPPATPAEDDGFRSKEDLDTREIQAALLYLFIPRRIRRYVETTSLEERTALIAFTVVQCAKKEEPVP